MIKQKSKFKRKYNPICYVCKHPIKELIKIKKLKEENSPFPEIDALSTEIARKVTCVGNYKNGDRMLRHNNGYCEPGGENYMKNKELARSWEKTCSTL